jgi:REP element-mobilizing transposase RayT
MEFRTWGGRRERAGRKPAGKRAGVRHRPRPRLARRHPVHVTVRLRAGLPNLRRFKLHQLIKAAVQGSHKKDSFHVVHYSVQGNHLHLLCEAEGEVALSRGMQGFNTRLARRLNRHWRRSGKVLADRYHVRQLRTPREVRNGLAYVLLNARRHGEHLRERRGWIDPFSSARHFDGWTDPRAVGRAPPGDPPVEAARTWLLTEGWRLHCRPIDAEEVPGAPRERSRQRSRAPGR